MQIFEMKRLSITVSICLAVSSLAVAGKPAPKVDGDAVKIGDASKALVLKAGDSCDVTIDKPNVRREGTRPSEPKAAPRNVGIDKQKPDQHLTYEPASDNINENATASIVLDQEQSVYTGGMSARALAGRSHWQSFTPARSGTLERLDLAFFGDVSGEGTLTVYSGKGVAGTRLFSASVRVVAGDGKAMWNSYAMKVPVSAGKTYTFQFTPDPEKMPDPFGVCVGSVQNSTTRKKEAAKPSYNRGILAIIDPSGEYICETMSSVFRTYVRPATQ